MINKQAVSNKYLSKIISKQTSPSRLTEFSNRSLSHADNLMSKIRSTQITGNVGPLHGRIAAHNNRLYSAVTAAEKSLDLSLKGR